MKITYIIEELRLKYGIYIEPTVKYIKDILTNKNK
jgi:hypothetical protein